MNVFDLLSSCLRRCASGSDVTRIFNSAPRHLRSARVRTSRYLRSALAGLICGLVAGLMASPGSSSPTNRVEVMTEHVDFRIVYDASTGMLTNLVLRDEGRRINY